MKHIANAALVGIIGLMIGFYMGGVGVLCVTGSAIDDDDNITDKHWIEVCKAYSRFVHN